MQKILGLMRRAILDYDMIQPGDHILAGVSGGKDSVVLLVALARLRSFLGIDFSLSAITLDPGFGGVQQDYAAIAELCQKYAVPYTVKHTEIGEIVFDIRQEPNPCSLCARMRRGALHDAAKALGCNKVALGHHANDAAETFLMNLFNEGRVGCFAPVTYLSRKDLTMIRPLVYTWERDIIRAAQANNLPIVKSRCPVDKTTNRQKTKEFLSDLERTNPGVTQRLIGAMQRGNVSGWAKNSSQNASSLHSDSSSG